MALATKQTSLSVFQFLARPSELLSAKTSPVQRVGSEVSVPRSAFLTCPLFVPRRMQRKIAVSVPHSAFLTCPSRSYTRRRRPRCCFSSSFGLSDLLQDVPAHDANG